MTETQTSSMPMATPPGHSPVPQPAPGPVAWTPPGHDQAPPVPAPFDPRHAIMPSPTALQTPMPGHRPAQAPMPMQTQIQPQMQPQLQPPMQPGPQSAPQPAFAPQQAAPRYAHAHPSMAPQPPMPTPSAPYGAPPQMAYAPHAPQHTHQHAPQYAPQAPAPHPAMMPSAPAPYGFDEARPEAMAAPALAPLAPDARKSALSGLLSRKSNSAAKPADATNDGLSPKSLLMGFLCGVIVMFLGGKVLGGDPQPEAAVAPIPVAQMDLGSGNVGSGNVAQMDLGALPDDLGGATFVDSALAADSTAP